MRLDPPGLSGPPPTIPPAARTAPKPVWKERGPSRRRASAHRKDLPHRRAPDRLLNDRQDRRVEHSSQDQRDRAAPARRRSYVIRVDRDDGPSRRIPRSHGVLGNQAVNVDEDDEDGDKERPRAGNATAFHVSPRSTSRPRSHELSTSIDSQTEPRLPRGEDLRSGFAGRSSLSSAEGGKDVPLEAQRRNRRPCCARRGRQTLQRRRSDVQPTIFHGERRRLEKPGDVLADVSDARCSAEASSVPSVDVLVAYTAFNDEDDDHDVQKLCSRPETYDPEGERPGRLEVHRFLEERVEESEDETKKVSSSQIQLLPETTTCIHVPGGYLQCPQQDDLLTHDVSEEDSLSSGRNEDPQYRERYHAGRGHGARYREDETSRDEQGTRRRRSNNTAWFPNSITERNGGGSFYDVRKVVHSEHKRPTRGGRYVRRNYGLFFILYLLAWPLLCFTAPTNTRAMSSSSFTQNPVIGRPGNFTRQQHGRNSSLLSSSSALALQSSYVKDRNVKDMATSNNKSTKLGYYQFSGEEDGYQGDQSVGLEPEWVHPYNEYTWEVNQINPWLSACDLAGPAPADLQGSCSPPFAPNSCPRPCGRGAGFQEVIEHLEAVEGFEFARAEDGRWLSARRNRTKAENRRDDRTKTTTTTTTTKTTKTGPDGARTTAPEQCLFYLEESHKRDVCRDDFGRGFLTPRENRYWYMSGLRLRHCCEHAVVNALAPGKGGPLEDVLNGGPRCHDALHKLLLLDDLAARLHCKFEEVLARYDCAQPYSVIYNCTHCKEAYRKWVCSSLVPYFAHEGPLDLEPSKVGWTGSRIRPCRSVCQSVEQRCPYLLPGDRAPAYPTQYAGEPTFLCRDPNIPETGEQAVRTLHSTFEDECCFRFCSEHELGSGICANCTGQESYKLVGRAGEVPAAPHCESAMPQFGPADPQQSDLSRAGSLETSNATLAEQQESSTWPSSTSSQRGTSFCGGGGVGTMSSSSSAGTGGVPWLVSLCALLLAIHVGQDVSRFLRGAVLGGMVGLPMVSSCRLPEETGSSGSRTIIRAGLASLLGRLACVNFRHVRPVLPRTTVKWCRGWCWWWCWWWYWCWWWWSSWRKRRKCANDPLSWSSSSVAHSSPQARRWKRQDDRPRRLPCRRTGKPSGLERPRRSRRRGRRRRGKPPDSPENGIPRSSSRFPSSPRWASKKDPP